MKLLTYIQPRRDGTVIYRDASGAPHTFVRSQSGDMVCDIADESTAVKMLMTDHFAPAMPEDFERANELIEAAARAVRAAPTVMDAEDDDDDDDRPDMAAPPQEAHTPPVRRGPGRPRKVT